MSTEENYPRRDFLERLGGSGLAGVALAYLAGKRSLAANADLSGNRGSGSGRGRSHFAPKAKRVLQIFCPGAVSHMDTWEHKPGLEKNDGKPAPGVGVTFQGKNGNLMRSPWKFKPRGESGKMVSELFPYLGEHVDDIAFVHSMTSKTNTHGPGCVFMNTGFTAEGFPSAGAWLSYALGSENEDLPTYVTLPDIRGIPPAGPANWSAGFLPADHQAVVLNAAEPIRNLERPSVVSASAEASTREFLALLNRRHLRRNRGNPQLDARMAAYELAARMQVSAPEAANLEAESEATHRLYGTRDANPLLAGFARNCLLARRFLERGVRFVTVYCASRASGVDGLLNWDAHKTLKSDYERHAPILDRPAAGLLKDLRSRGLLDDTLVLWTTEFGRMPTHQQGSTGRDHNPDGFTCWMTGAGVKGGMSYGATDELGQKSVENVATVYDFHATVLHLLGLDHERTTFNHNGVERRLTDVHGHVIHDILA